MQVGDYERENCIEQMKQSQTRQQFCTSRSAYLANICPFHSPVIVTKGFLSSGDLHCKDNTKKFKRLS